MKCWINVGGMLDECLCRLHVTSNMFHPTCKFIHSFIRCQIKDGDVKIYKHQNDNETIDFIDMLKFKHIDEIYRFVIVPIFFFHFHLSQFPQPFFFSDSSVYLPLDLPLHCMLVLLAFSFSAIFSFFCCILPHFVLVI